MLIQINFWQAKQLEYWLKDNYPECTVSAIDYDRHVPPEELDWYRVDGPIDVDLSCMIQLKYGKAKEETTNGKI
jgi:hypothetical protein